MKSGRRRDRDHDDGVPARRPGGPQSPAQPEQPCTRDYCRSPAVRTPTRNAVPCVLFLEKPNVPLKYT